jgi:thioredoxin-related protein
LKNLLLGIALITSLGIANAQEWKTDLEQGEKIAKEENKKIILVFQGSDWCAPCIKLDKEIWSTEEFKDYASKNFVMVQADFPRKKANRLPKEQEEKNGLLAEKYNQQGFFPHVVVLNSEGNVLGQVGYKKIPPSEYIKLLESF